MKTNDTDDWPRLIDDARQFWDAKAAFWDAEMGEGNAFQLELLQPAVERLLALQPDERILDVGCGNGVFARRLARLGARVVAVDQSAQFLDLARSRAPDLASRIDYRLVDATDEHQLLALGEGRFDAILSNMALMDMPVLDPLLRAATRLLTPGGRFVFSVQHPAFNSIAVRLCAETETREDGIEVTTHAVKVSDYLTPSTGKSTGMLGEPAPHWSFHRPLHELFGAFFRTGFVLDGLQEPAFTPISDTPRATSWRNLPGIPPVLVARFILWPRRRGVRNRHPNKLMRTSAKSGPPSPAQRTGHSSARHMRCVTKPITWRSPSICTPFPAPHTLTSARLILFPSPHAWGLQWRETREGGEGLGMRGHSPRPRSGS